MRTLNEMIDELDAQIEEYKNPQYDYSFLDNEDTPDCLDDDKEVKLCDYCENLGNNKCMNIGYC